MCFYSCTQNVFSEAKAEVIRNSLPLFPCVGGGRGWRWPGGDGKTLRGRRHAATLSYWGWLGGGKLKKGESHGWILEVMWCSLLEGVQQWFVVLIFNECSTIFKNLWSLKVIYMYAYLWQFIVLVCGNTERIDDARETAQLWESITAEPSWIKNLSL